MLKRHPAALCNGRHTDCYILSLLEVPVVDVHIATPPTDQTQTVGIVVVVVTSIACSYFLYLQIRNQAKDGALIMKRMDTTKSSYSAHYGNAIALRFIVVRFFINCCLNVRSLMFKIIIWHNRSSIHWLYYVVRERQCGVLKGVAIDALDEPTLCFWFLCFLNFWSISICVENRLKTY